MRGLLPGQRGPLGTRRGGQMLLGLGGLLIGLSAGAGLWLWPSLFSELLKRALLIVSHGRFHYRADMRVYFEVGLPAMGGVWAMLMAWAWFRQPARDRALDAYLMRQQAREQTAHTRFQSADTVDPMP